MKISNISPPDSDVATRFAIFQQIDLEGIARQSLALHQQLSRPDLGL